MDAERVEFLFGPEVASDLDADDLETESYRMELVAEHLSPPVDSLGLDGDGLDGDLDPDGDGDLITAIRTILVNQILDDEPPVAWRTVERLRDAGLDRDDIISQMSVVLSEAISGTLSDGEEFVPAAYEAALDELPLPDPTELARALIAAVRDRPGRPIADVIDEVVQSHSSGSTAIEMMVDRMLDWMVQGPIVLLPEDESFSTVDLIGGRTFSHRLTDAEAELGVVSVGFDVGPMIRFPVVRLADGTDLEQFAVEYGHLGWRGPDGWLSAFAPGDLLAITVSVDSPDGGANEALAAEVTIERLDREPAVTDELVTAVRTAYDENVAEPGLPVNGDEIAMWLCARRPDLLEAAAPPLSELCAAAGLEQRGGLVAHDDSIWRTDLFRRRFNQVMDVVGESEDRRTLGRALEALDDPEAPVDDIRRSLVACFDAHLVDILADVLFPPWLAPDDEHELDGVDAPGHLFRLVDRAIAAARRPNETAVGEYLAAVLRERTGEPERAEEHLMRAVTSGADFGQAVERLGWYRFDRGDARGAMKWWRELEELPPAAEAIAPFLDAASGRKLGRNEPCWCGSGRKFKQCHQNVVEMPPLPDRVGWLTGKATAWVDHGHPDVRRDVVELGAIRATGDPDMVFGDLAAEVSHDELMSMLEDAFADPIVLDAALYEGGWFELFLRDRGPLLPDDEQLLAASWLTIERSVHEVVSVDPGRTMALRNLATGDVVEVRERTLSGSASEGELYCARVVPDGAGNQIVGGVFPVRPGTESTVLDVCSEGDARELCAWVGGLYQPPTITHQPGMIDSMFDLDQLQSIVEGLGDDADSEAIDAAMRAELGRQAQARWLDEEVPALGGVTPREAAADPTRREQLERLLQEFRTMNDRSGGDGGDAAAVVYDVDEIRRELGLD